MKYLPLSGKTLNEIQLLNIQLILIILEVFHLDILLLILIREIQFKKIECISYMIC